MTSEAILEREMEKEEVGGGGKQKKKSIIMATVQRKNARVDSLSVQQTRRRSKTARYWSRQQRGSLTGTVKNS